MKFTSLAIIAMLAASPALAAGKPSQAFLKKAIEGNYAEVQMGKLAQQNGESADVKKYGQMLVDDHTAGNQKAIDAAKSLGMTPPVSTPRVSSRCCRSIWMRRSRCDPRNPPPVRVRFLPHL